MDRGISLESVWGNTLAALRKPPCCIIYCPALLLHAYYERDMFLKKKKCRYKMRYNKRLRNPLS